MYIEGFEGLEDTEREPRRTYGSSSEMEKLIRENNKLKESLEKEKFFNKLLDQEIQELKSTIPNGGRTVAASDYWSGSRKVSKGAFYTLLFISLLMAAYIGYGIYYDKKFNYLKQIGDVPQVQNQLAPATSDENTQASTPAANIPDNNSSANSTPEKAAAAVPPTVNNKDRGTAPVVKDSVPNIIGTKKNTAAAEKRKAVTATEDEEYNEDEVKAAISEPVSTSGGTSTPSAKTNTPPPVAQNRTVIARYKVTSKANFYNSPDENSMRGTFISGDANKTVDALEDRNGFIFVEYTNDLGFTSKGWLSKKDLTKD